MAPDGTTGDEDDDASCGPGESVKLESIRPSRSTLVVPSAASFQWDGSGWGNGGTTVGFTYFGREGCVIGS